MHWVIVGPSGHEERASAGGVLRHYTHCNAAGSPWIKTIANTFYLANIAYHPHNFEFRCGSCAFFVWHAYRVDWRGRCWRCMAELLVALRQAATLGDAGTHARPAPRRPLEWQSRFLWTALLDIHAHARLAAIWVHRCLG